MKKTPSVQDKSLTKTYGLTQSELEILKEFFDSVDESKTGYLSREDMKHMLVTVNDEDLDEEDVKTILN
jgi:Ca2+-binding EF-hand superfamily protein